MFLCDVALWIDFLIVYTAKSLWHAAAWTLTAEHIHHPDLHTWCFVSYRFNTHFFISLTLTQHRHTMMKHFTPEQLNLQRTPARFSVVPSVAPGNLWSVSTPLPTEDERNKQERYWTRKNEQSVVNTSTRREPTIYCFSFSISKSLTDVTYSTVQYVQRIIP